MKIEWTPRVSRATALILLLIVLAVVAGVVAWWAIDKHREYDRAIDTRLDRLAAYQRIISARSDLDAAIARAGKLDTAKYMLKNSSPALAAADIQQMVQAVLEAHAMKLTSMQIVPHKDDAGRRKITVNVQARGNTEALQKTLYALETSLPYLFVDNLIVRSPINSRRWVPLPNVEPEIQAQFDVYGYAALGKKK
jgi:general secretion pathway protein M